MTPTEATDWRRYMEQRHNDLRSDYCGSDGNAGFKKDIQVAVYALQKKDERDDGFREGVKSTLALQNKILGALIALVGLVVTLLIYYGSHGSAQHGLFSLTNSQSVVAVETGIRDTSR